MIFPIVFFATLHVVASFRFTSQTLTKRNHLKVALFNDIYDTVPSIMQAMDSSLHFQTIANDIHQHSFMVADEAVSVYSKVDKTGFIGVIADYIERAIDFSHSLLEQGGLKNTYGYSIILFTILVKIATFPLVTTQIESTSKLQKLTPMQQKIQTKYANDEETKNRLLSQLFQAANANPLAGCLPAVFQIPIFIALYRALQNLVAENKLNEPFLWIPDLEGPVYMNPPATSMDWIKSAFTGSPQLGWSDTLAFASLPILLYISQSISQKVLQPPQDPKKVLTEQEMTSQAILNYLPVMVAFFSFNVPAGLGIYWVFNNMLTTVVTLFVKNKFKDDVLPAEVAEIMAMVDDNTAGKVSSSSARSAAIEELKGGAQFVDDKPKKIGFGSVAPVEMQALEAAEGLGETSDSVDTVVEQSSADLAESSEKKGKSRSKASKKDRKKN